MAEDSKLAKWTDTQKDWKGYVKQIKGYKIRNKDVYKILKQPDPRQRDRVTARYQVDARSVSLRTTKTKRAVRWWLCGSKRMRACEGKVIVFVIETGVQLRLMLL